MSIYRSRQILRKPLGVLLVAAAHVSGLTIDNNGPNEAITGNWTNTGTVSFSGSSSLEPYKSGISIAHGGNDWGNLGAFNYGLVIQNGRQSAIDNTFTGASIVLQVKGENTVMRYGGDLTCEVGFFDVRISNHGKLVISRDAKVDLVNSALYTRQMWVLGDGTGVFEVEDGFVSDRSKGVGFASYRFSNTTFISHSTEGLPTNAMNGCNGCPPGYEPLNGHLVFENEGGSRWIVKTNDQVYKAALWIWKSITMETQRDLTHVGRLARLLTEGHGEYRLAAAFQLMSPGITLAKEGPASLNLNGEQAYEQGTSIDIKEGTVNFNTDATGGWFRPGDQQGAQELTVLVRDGATAAFNYDPVRIKNLECSSGATVSVSTAGKADISGTAKLAGTLKVTVGPGQTPKGGDSFTIFAWNPTGTFANLDLPEGATWDTSKLYTHGIISITSGQVRMTTPLTVVPTGVRTRIRVLTLVPRNALPALARETFDIFGRKLMRGTQPGVAVVR